MAGPLTEMLGRLLGTSRAETAFAERREALLAAVPVPVFWLLGKTQSGKTSIVRYLTGAEAAVIGEGYRPTTRTSSVYPFPNPQTPLLRFIDTRGLGEVDYDPAEDIARFAEEAHVIIVTARVTDHAQEAVVRTLRALRKVRPQGPVVLALSCLHQALPGAEHPAVYPWNPRSITPTAPGVPVDLARSIDHHRQTFAGLVDRVVPIDLTPPEEGFAQPDFGGPALKDALLDLLPAAYREALVRIDLADSQLADLHKSEAAPIILAYAGMASAAGAVPVPVLDLTLLAGVQTHLLYRLARLYGQPLSGRRLAELSSALGGSLVLRQAARIVLTKWVPLVGSAVGAGVAFTSTFALGKAFCWYYERVLHGHVPPPRQLRRYYRHQIREATALWKPQRDASGSAGDS